MKEPIVYGTPVSKKFAKDLPRITKMCQPYFSVIPVISLFAANIRVVCGM